MSAPISTLKEVVRRYGTPTYAYDLDRIGSQVVKLRTQLPSTVEILYSLKANGSLGLCGFLAEQGLGADVASAGELLTALEAGFPPGRILVSGPDKSPAMLSQLRLVPEAMLSVDSPSELQVLVAAGLPHRALLRLRPDFPSLASCAAGPDSRFGFRLEDLAQYRSSLATRNIRVAGFHVFAGSQVLDAAAVVRHLHGALELSLRARHELGLNLEIIDLGGGFGIPYGPADQELDLAPIANALRSWIDRLAPVRLVLELGRYFVAQAGWYLTTVLARQTHQGREAVVVDGGTHQRGDMCGLGLRTRAFPPFVLEEKTDGRMPINVLGCLSLPADVLAEAALLPPLSPGDVLAFPNAGAYGLGASPCHFHGYVAPAEVAFEGNRLRVLRARPQITTIMEGQERLATKASHPA